MVFESIESGSRAEFRRNAGREDDSEPPLTLADHLRELPPADADDALNVEIIDAEPMTPDDDGERRSAVDSAPEFSPFGGPLRPTGPAGGGMMTLEDAVAAQAEMRRQAVQHAPAQRALPRGRSDR